MARSPIDMFSVHIKNLPIGANEEDLVQIFDEAGQVKRHFVESNPPHDHYTYAFMRYGTEEEAKMAIKLFDGMPFKGRPLTVSMANNQPGSRAIDARHSGRPRMNDRPSMTARPKRTNFDQERIKEIQEALVKLNLNKTMPLFIRELRNVTYEMFPPETYPPAPFNFDTGTIETLMQAKELETNGYQVRRETSSRSDNVRNATDDHSTASSTNAYVDSSAKQQDLTALVHSCSNASSDTQSSKLQTNERFTSEGSVCTRDTSGASFHSSGVVLNLDYESDLQPQPHNRNLQSERFSDADESHVKVDERGFEARDKLKLQIDRCVESSEQLKNLPKGDTCDGLRQAQVITEQKTDTQSVSACAIQKLAKGRGKGLMMLNKPKS